MRESLDEEDRIKLRAIEEEASSRGRRRNFYTTIEIKDSTEDMAKPEYEMDVEFEGILGRDHSTMRFPVFSIVERLNTVEKHLPAQLSISTTSNATFELAKQWIKRCLSKHTACNQIESSPSLLPTRILDVGSLDETDVVRIYACDELDISPGYLTLSHCWGGKDTLKLTFDSFSAFAKGISMDDLSKTYRDTVVFTRRLGHKYLWVDPLCIIQDSKEDWMQESAAMGGIYRNSTCTIAALGAKDSHDGCFVHRDPLTYRACRLHANADKSLVAYNFGFDAQSIHIGKRDTPLLSRAWVLQERLLSPRTLYFSSEAICWECLELDATEPNPYGEQ